ncbi:MAG: TerB family tellurite resistance protein [Cyclobacteriaceae bacterium]
MNDLSRMKLLINLAKVDGQVADKEKSHLVNIGRANGIYPDEIYPLFTQNHTVIIPEHLTDDQKFDLILNLIQLMKLDERMYREEIVFCGEVASKLGYNKQVMFELLSHVKSAGMESMEVEKLKTIIQKFLNQKA